MPSSLANELENIGTMERKLFEIGEWSIIRNITLQAGNRSVVHFQRRAMRRLVFLGVFMDLGMGMRNGVCTSYKAADTIVIAQRGLCQGN